MKCFCKIIRKIILWFFDTRLHSWLVLSVIPYIRFSFYYTSFKGWMYQRGYSKLRPGYIVLTDDRKKLTSSMVPRVWTHATLCVAKGSEVEIIEMTHTGFTESTFYDLCHESTRVGIFECTDWDLEYTPKVIAKGFSFRGVPYDVKAEQGDDALTCFELIVEADFEHRMKVSYEDILGIIFGIPSGISEAVNIRKVWDSNDEIK